MNSDIPEVRARPGTTSFERDAFSAEVRASKIISNLERVESKDHSYEIVNVGVSRFDELISSNGIERGSTILISGGCGTGKTTFTLQSLWHGLTHGEKCIYISFEEDPKKIRVHMKQNFGWDFKKYEDLGTMKFIRLDPIKIARAVEAARFKKEGSLMIEVEPIRLPFVPHRIGIDSLSALSIAFENEENYRKYIRQLFEAFEAYNSINFILTETEQNPTIYSRAGVEEFLADGVIVLYNIKIKAHRENALEILKLRSSGHVKRLVPYEINETGVIIYPDKTMESKSIY